MFSESKVHEKTGRGGGNNWEVSLMWGLFRTPNIISGMRHKTVTIRLSDLEHNLIKTRAQKIGLRLADYVRMQTLERATEVKG